MNFKENRSHTNRLYRPRGYNVCCCSNIFCSATTKITYISKISLFPYPSHFSLFFAIQHHLYFSISLPLSFSLSLSLSPYRTLHIKIVVPFFFFLLLFLFFTLDYSCFCRHCFLLQFTENHSIRWLTHFSNSISKLLQLALNFTLKCSCRKISVNNI